MNPEEFVQQLVQLVQTEENQFKESYGPSSGPNSLSALTLTFILHIQGFIDEHWNSWMKYDNQNEKISNYLISVRDALEAFNIEVNTSKGFVQLIIQTQSKAMRNIVIKFLGDKQGPRVDWY